jgi:cyclase
MGCAVVEKRIVGVVTVLNGWAVQSFGYGRYLPLGHPEVLVANLDRWGADEILLQCIDRSRVGAGPDLGLLEKVSRKGLSTPLIYAGGVRCADDAIAAVKAGADRVCLDAALHDDLAQVLAIAGPLGSQAIVAALPLSWTPDGLQWLDYRRKIRGPLAPALIEAFRRGAISEALVIDWQAEGTPGAFDLRLLGAETLQGIPLIAFGGLAGTELVREVLGLPQVVAVAQGNFLSYQEHAVQALKQQLHGLPVRGPEYAHASTGGHP